MSEKEEGSSPSGQRNIENPGYVYFSLPVAAQLTERGFVNSVKWNFHRLKATSYKHGLLPK